MTDLWLSFRAALIGHQHEPSAQSEANAVAACQRWAREFVPEAAEIIVGEYRDKLTRARRAA